MAGTGARLGIDVGGSSVRMIMADAGDRRSEVVAAGVPDSYRGLLDLVEKMATRLAGTCLTAVGCGLPGWSDADRALFMPALPWLEGEPLRADLESLLGADVTLGVDAHLALLAEAREGAAKGFGSALLVAVGTGVGGAIMLDGRIWRGRRGTAGSWGWLPSPGASSDGLHGAFERVASGTALSQRAGTMTPPTSATDLVEAARSGSRGHAKEVARFARVLGRGLAAIASSFDPDLVIVGGGLSAAMDVLWAGLSDAMSRWASPAARDVAIVPALLGPSAGVVGALLAAGVEASPWW